MMELFSEAGTRNEPPENFTVYCSECDRPMIDGFFNPKKNVYLCSKCKTNQKEEDNGKDRPE